MPSFKKKHYIVQLVVVHSAWETSSSLIPGWMLPFTPKPKLLIESELPWCWPVYLILMNLSYPIIKRRIAWLLGRLVSEQCSAPNNPKVWETLVHLLRDRSLGSDAVVRLTAATALCECVNVCLVSLLPHFPTFFDLISGKRFRGGDLCSVPVHNHFWAYSTHGWSG